MLIGVGVGIGLGHKQSAPASSKVLRMNGTSDHLKTPAITYTKIIVDAKWTLKSGAYQDYWGDSSLSNGLQHTSGNVDHIFGASATAYLNGAAQTDSTAYVPNGTRCTIEVDYASAIAGNAIQFCANGGGSSLFTQSDIYDIKIYNGTTLLAHYDMSTGTVNDQSGNNNNGTLTGGTWVNV